MMKKRFWAVLLAAAMVFSTALTGCSEKAPAGNYAAPAALTESEKELLKLVGARENCIFDFEATEQVDALRFFAYQLVDGEWVRKAELGGFYGMADAQERVRVSKGRFALLFETIPEGVTISVGTSDGSGVTGATFQPAPFEAPTEGGMTATETLWEKKALEGTGEIPLVIQIIGENTYRTCSVDDFWDPAERLVQSDYLGVYALTMSFEEQPQ